MIAAPSSSSIAICGAGIAGLTAALCFAKNGFQVNIYEKCSQLQEVGAGLQLGSNATKILQQLNLLDTCQKKAFTPTDICLKDAKNNKTLFTFPLGDYAQKRWGAPYLTMHRADLQNILLNAVHAITNISLFLDHEIIGIKGKEFLLNTPQGRQTKTAALLVAADGVHSKLAEAYFGKEAISLTPFIAWRKTITRQEAEKLFGPCDYSKVKAWMGVGNHLVAYPIAAGEQYNLVAITQTPAPHHPEARPQNLLYEYFDQTESCYCTDILQHLTNWKIWPLLTRKNINFIHKDAPHLCFIGDAAHAFLPFAAQGACMAIEDAAALALYWKKYGQNPSKALQLFSETRQKRIKQVLRYGTQNGKLYHLRQPLAGLRNIAMQLVPVPLCVKAFDPLYAYSIDKA